MTTKTFHDIYDLVELVSMLKNANIELSMQDGTPYFSVTNFSDGAIPRPIDSLKINNSSFIYAYLENTEKAYQMILEKIDSGAWEKNNDCA